MEMAEDVPAMGSTAPRRDLRCCGRHDGLTSGRNSWTSSSRENKGPC